MTEEPSRIYASARLVTAEEFRLAHGEGYFHALGARNVAPGNFVAIRQQIQDLSQLVDEGFIEIFQVPSKEGMDYTIRMVDFADSVQEDVISTLRAVHVAGKDRRVCATIEPYHINAGDSQFYLQAYISFEPSSSSARTAQPGDKIMSARSIGLVPKIRKENLQNTQNRANYNSFPSRIHWVLPSGGSISTRDCITLDAERGSRSLFFGDGYIDDVVRLISEKAIRPLLDMRDMVSNSSKWDYSINATAVLQGRSSGINWVAKPGTPEITGHDYADIDRRNWLIDGYNKELARLIMDKVIESPLEDLLEFL